LHRRVTLARSGIEAFAVEDRSVQLVWSGLPAPVCTFGIDATSVTVEAGPPARAYRAGRPPRPLGRMASGPGSVVIDGLAPGARSEVWMSPRGGRRRSLGWVTTLTPPPGRLLSRFATFSDPHVGETRFGGTNRIVEGPDLQGRSAARCLASAVREAAAWGAEVLVSRGDLTRSSHPQQFSAAARILTAAGLPALTVLGNHDVRHRVDGAAILGANGVTVSTDVTVHDLPGLRLVLVHSPLTNDHRGDLPPGRITRVADACAGAPPRPDGRPGPAAVILHHPLTDRERLTPYPPGVPVDQSRRLGQTLNRANPDTVVLAGHRHRTRRRTIAGLDVSEVGSTKDYPGVWAGYAVHEGGIRQVVRRVADPAALAWTESTGEAIGGLWSRWSPGRLDDRCWVRTW
jgi:Icc protein